MSVHYVQQNLSLHLVLKVEVQGNKVRVLLVLHSAITIQN